MPHPHFRHCNPVTLRSCRLPSEGTEGDFPFQGASRALKQQSNREKTLFTSRGALRSTYGRSTPPLEQPRTYKLLLSTTTAINSRIVSLCRFNGVSICYFVCRHSNKSIEGRFLFTDLHDQRKEDLVDLLS